MEINYIKEFVVLSEICNYGRAADALFVAQSSLFNHIKALEAELGIALFDRSGKKVVLSDYGRIFLTYAQMIIDASDQSIQAIQDRSNEVDKTIRIGTQYRITDLVKDFRRTHQEYRLNVVDSYNSLEVLNEDFCELAFIRNMTDPDGRYHIMPFIKDNFIVALYTSHPMAGRKNISIRELKNENFITIAKYHNQESHAMRLCKEAGFIPKVVLATQNGKDAASLVNDGEGISLLLKETIKADNFSNIVIVDLDPPIECDISLCWNKDKPLSAGAKAFIEYAKGYHKQGVSL